MINNLFHVGCDLNICDIPVSKVTLLLCVGLNIPGQCYSEGPKMPLMSSVIKWKNYMNLYTLGVNYCYLKLKCKIKKKLLYEIILDVTILMPTAS